MVAVNFQESFLEDVNCILNSGEVPDLFDNEEIDGIAMELKAAAAESQIPDTRIDVYNFFIRVSPGSIKSFPCCYPRKRLVFISGYITGRHGVGTLIHKVAGSMPNQCGQLT